MSVLETVLVAVVVVESGVLIALFALRVAATLDRREQERITQNFRIEMCESQIKTIFKKLKAVEAYIESTDIEEDDEYEGEYVSPLSELFGILSTSKKKEEGEADEALPEN